MGDDDFENYYLNIFFEISDSIEGFNNLNKGVNFILNNLFSFWQLDFG